MQLVLVSAFSQNEGEHIPPQQTNAIIYQTCSGRLVSQFAAHVTVSVGKPLAEIS